MKASVSSRSQEAKNGASAAGLPPSAISAAITVPGHAREPLRGHLGKRSPPEQS
jgi:hypothetical protein